MRSPCKADQPYQNVCLSWFHKDLIVSFGDSRTSEGFKISTQHLILSHAKSRSLNGIPFPLQFLSCSCLRTVDEQEVRPGFAPSTTRTSWQESPHTQQLNMLLLRDQGERLSESKRLNKDSRKFGHQSAKDFARFDLV